MSNQTKKTNKVGIESKVSWLPLMVVVLTQIQASFNVNALTVSMAGLTQDLRIPPTAIGTAITTGTFAMASFIMLGAKIGSKYGTKKVFQIAVFIHALSMALVAFAVNGPMLYIGQALGGAVIALIAPALTVLIAANYSGKQQASAIGFLAAAIPGAGILALLIAGNFANTIGWRWSFILVVVLGFINLLLSTRLKKIEPQSALQIDWKGAVLSSSAIILLSFGFSFLSSWGAFRARSGAPFDILGISPAIILLVISGVLIEAFFSHLKNQKEKGKTQLFDLRVLATSEEKATTVAMATMLFIGTAANFLIPLYMQVVQGLNGIQTSFSIIPYTISIFVANTLVVRLYDRFSASQIARTGFVGVAAALSLIAFTIRNSWGQAPIVIGLILLGLSQGAIVALVFNTLLNKAPKEISGHVGAWRGLVHNISGSVGISVMTVFSVTLLGSLILSSAVASPAITKDVIDRLNFDNVNFITNDQVEGLLTERTDATPEEIAEAVEINAQAKLRALQTSLLLLALLAVLAIIPAGKMPKFQDYELSVGYPEEAKVAVKKSKS
jgi:MFS family permease